MEQKLNQKWVAKDGAFLFFKFGVFYHAKPDPLQVTHEFTHFLQVIEIAKKYKIPEFVAYPVFLVMLAAQTIKNKIKLGLSWQAAYLVAPLEAEARNKEQIILARWKNTGIQELSDYLDFAEYEAREKS